jgi:hypothetical protein
MSEERDPVPGLLSVLIFMIAIFLCLSISYCYFHSEHDNNRIIECINKTNDPCGCKLAIDGANRERPSTCPNGIVKEVPDDGGVH